MSVLRPSAAGWYIGKPAAGWSSPARIARTWAMSVLIASRSASLVCASSSTAMRRFCSTTMSSNLRDGAASSTSPATGTPASIERAAMRGAIIAPWLWPNRNTREASTCGTPASVRSAATASSVVSLSMVNAPGAT